MGAAPPLTSPVDQCGRARGGRPARRRITAGAAVLAIAWASTAAAVTIPRFGAPLPMAVPPGPDALVTADVNGDRIPDVIVTSSFSGRVTTLLGLGDGGFRQATSIRVAAGPRAIAAGDFNGDGRVDVAVVQNAADRVAVLLGNGRGSFTAASSASTLQPQALASGDVNGDGRLDLVAGSLLGGVTVMLGAGDGTFPTSVPLATGGGVSRIVVADVTADGRADVLTANQKTNDVTLLAGRTDGTFAPPRSLPLPSLGQYSTATGPAGMAVGDVTGDGVPDIVVAEGGDGAVLFGGTGGGTFAPPRALGGGPDSAAVAIGDLNRDGLPDLAVADRDAARVRVLVADGAGGFVEFSSLTGRSPIDLALTDLNGDGNPDLVSADIASARVSALLGGVIGPAAVGLTAAPVIFRPACVPRSPRRCRPGGGTTLRFTLSASASVRLTTRRGTARGRVVARTSATGRPGPNRVVFRGLAAGRPLPPGRYAIGVQAVNRLGHSRVLTAIVTLR